MQNLTKLFDYQGNKVTFKNENGVAYVNATQMAKKFGKRPAEYLRLPSTMLLVKAIVGKSHIDEKQLIVTVRGGKTPGTWMHEDIALDFSQWLSIDFKLWCNDRIKELLTTGTASLQALPNTKQLAQMVIDAENKREEAERNLAIAMPRFDYVETVFKSDNTFNANEIAQDFGLTAEAFNKKLHELGVHYRQGKTWMLYAQHRNQGFTKQITMMRGQKPITHTVWTEKGRAFIHANLNPEMRMSIARKNEAIYRLSGGLNRIN